MDVSLGDLARSRAVAQSDGIAFVCGAESLTYAELDSCADTVARRLAESGVVAGARVGYLGRNHLGYPVVAVAASKLRAICVGLNWRLAPAELAGVLGDAAPHVVFADAEFVESARAATVLLDPASSGVGVPMIVDLGSAADRLASWAAEADGPAASHTRTDDAADRVSDANDVCQLVYTSGTTGRPKGVMTSNRALFEHLHTPPPWTIDATSVVLIVSPVFHAVGVVWTAFVIDVGATGVLLPDPDPVTVLTEVERRGVTHTVWVPALLQVLLDHPSRPERELTSLRTVIYGASPISEQLLERAFECLPECEFVQGYGMTETTGPVTYLEAAEHVTGSPRLRTAGRAASNCEVRVVDLTTGEAAEPGRPGEVQARSAQLCDGYWNNDDETAALFTPDGWLRTGDIGHVDADGYLTLTDRVKDVIVSGGENVYSGEVERVLLSIPAVAEACVVGAPSERWGETVTAVVVLRADGDSEGAIDGRSVTGVDAESIIAYCRDRLAHYKCPAAVHFAATLPRTPSGKVLRRAVRAPFWPDSDHPGGAA